MKEQKYGCKKYKEEILGHKSFHFTTTDLRKLRSFYLAKGGKKLSSTAAYLNPDNKDTYKKPYKNTVNKNKTVKKSNNSSTSINKNYEQRCNNLGLTRGTSEYASCVIDLESLDIQKQTSANIDKSNQEMLRQHRQQQQRLKQQQDAAKSQRQSEALMRMGNYLLQGGQQRRGFNCMWNPIGMSCN